MQPAPGTPPALIRARLALALKLALFVCILLLAGRVSDWLLGQLGFHLSPKSEPMLHRLIMLATAVYVVLMVLPFCPGIEIGLGMIVLLGPPIVPLVYAATVVALLLAFLIGRLVPARSIINVLDLLRLHRARDLLRRIEPLDRQARLQLLHGAARGAFLRGLLRHRYVAVAIALNTPGNIVIGDGGGIALAAGFSRLFSFPAFAVTVALAAAPVPLIILLTGG